MAEEIRYPYLPEGRTIEYVTLENRLMSYAKAYARERSLDRTMPTGAILVRKGVALGMGANGSQYHLVYGCARVLKGCKSGEGYELCPGCHPKNHSERKAVEYAFQRGYDARGSELYLWGHWWCCEGCWSVMIQAGILRVFLLNNSWVFFNKQDPNNVIGRQFDD